MRYIYIDQCAVESWHVMSVGYYCLSVLNIYNNIQIYFTIDYVISRLNNLAVHNINMPALAV